MKHVKYSRYCEPNHRKSLLNKGIYTQTTTFFTTEKQTKHKKDNRGKRNAVQVQFPAFVWLISYLNVIKNQQDYL